MTEVFEVTNNNAVLTQGVFSFENVKINMTPSTETEWEVIFTDFETSGDNSFVFVPDLQQLKIVTRACIVGERYTPDQACELCPPGTYLFEAQNAPGICNDC